MAKTAKKGKKSKTPPPPPSEESPSSRSGSCLSEQAIFIPVSSSSSSSDSSDSDSDALAVAAAAKNAERSSDSDSDAEAKEAAEDSSNKRKRSEDGNGDAKKLKAETGEAVAPPVAPASTAEGSGGNCGSSTLYTPTDVAVAEVNAEGGDDTWVRVSWQYAGGAVEAATTAFEVEMAVAVAGNYNDGDSGSDGDGDGDGDDDSDCDDDCDDDAQKFRQVYVGSDTRCVVLVPPPADNADADYNAAVTVRVRATHNPTAAAVAAGSGGGGGGGSVASSGWCHAAVGPTVVPISVVPWRPFSPLLPSPAAHSRLLLQWIRQQTGGLAVASLPAPVLLFRASAHGFRASDFHARVDGRGPHTLTLVRATTGHVFGAFATAPWSSDNSYACAPGSFLFALTATARSVVVPCIMPLKGKGWERQAVRHQEGYGPTFGRGHDLCIADNADASAASHHNIGRTYILPHGAADNTFLTGGGSAHFKVQDYEVYSVAQ